MGAAEPQRILVMLLLTCNPSVGWQTIGAGFGPSTVIGDRVRSHWPALPGNKMAPPRLRLATPIRAQSTEFEFGAWERINKMKNDFKDPRDQHPEELFGPWELTCTVSGFESTWIELREDFRCDCSKKTGKCLTWAVRGSPGKWKMRFALADKLNRPIHFKCNAIFDESEGWYLADGQVIGPPKMSATEEERKKGLLIGLFSGFKLPN